MLSSDAFLMQSAYSPTGKLYPSAALSDLTKAPKPVGAGKAMHAPSETGE